MAGSTTEFQQVQAALEALSSGARELAARLAGASEASTDAQARRTLAAQVEALRSESLAELAPRVAKLKAKAEQVVDELEDGTKVWRYGPAMRKRILGLVADFESARVAVAALANSEAVADLAAHIEADDARAPEMALRMERERVQKAEEMQRLDAAAREAQRKQAEEREKQAEAKRNEAARRVAADALRVSAEEELVAAETARLKAHVVRGEEGLLGALQLLRVSAARDAALGALHIFEDNLVRHADDEQFRRLKFGNPKFDEIRVVPGVCEFLFAAGWEPAVVAGEPPVVAYVTREPPLSNLDAWSAWFDMHKRALSAIELEMIEFA